MANLRDVSNEALVSKLEVAAYGMMLPTSGLTREQWAALYEAKDEITAELLRRLSASSPQDTNRQGANIERVVTMAEMSPDFTAMAAEQGRIQDEKCWRCREGGDCGEEVCRAPQAQRSAGRVEAGSEQPKACRISAGCIRARGHVGPCH